MIMNNIGILGNGEFILIITMLLKRPALQIFKKDITLLC